MVSIMAPIENPMVYVRSDLEGEPVMDSAITSSVSSTSTTNAMSAMPPPMMPFPIQFPPVHSGGQQMLAPVFLPTQMAGIAGITQGAMGLTFDGKRMRRSVQRKTVDYNAPICQYLENRLYKKSLHGTKVLQPHAAYYMDMLPPMGMLDNPMNAVTTRFVRMSTNKFKCPIHVVRWTPEGRRLITGASSGEFTLWNGLTFNFETILQAHETALRVMQWNRNDTYMLTGDHTGHVKYWQSNMNNVKEFDAHNEVIRDASFCPTDNKFITCSDDSLVKVWDFLTCTEERAMRGHGAEVKCCDWHPQKGLIVSGSKDTQQPVKLWDPRSAQSLSTLHIHKGTVMRVKWNRNGNWLLTASRDHLIKVFDIRAMKELQVFRGHKKEVMSIAWHPVHESLFVSGGGEGSVLFWMVGTDREVGGMDTAHDGMVLTLDWHPLGHVLASGSNDHTAKFWTRNRPGDKMQDRYNLNTVPNDGLMDDGLIEEIEMPITIDEKCIPGMGEIKDLDISDAVIAELAPTKMISKSNEKTGAKAVQQVLPGFSSEVIPGLQISTDIIKGEHRGPEGEAPRYDPTRPSSLLSNTQSHIRQLAYPKNDDYGFDGDASRPFDTTPPPRQPNRPPPPHDQGGPRGRMNSYEDNRKRNFDSGPGNENSQYQDDWYEGSGNERGTRGRIPSGDRGRGGGYRGGYDRGGYDRGGYDRGGYHDRGGHQKGGNYGGFNERGEWGEWDGEERRGRGGGYKGRYNDERRGGRGRGRGRGGRGRGDRGGRRDRGGEGRGRGGGGRGDRGGDDRGRGSEGRGRGDRGGDDRGRSDRGGDRGHGR